MNKSKSVYKRLIYRLTYLLSKIDFKLENFAVENRTLDRLYIIKPRLEKDFHSLVFKLDTYIYI